MAKFKHNPRILCDEYFRLAKFWFGASLVSKALLFILGAVTIFGSIYPLFGTLIVFSMTILSEVSILRSDHLKKIANSILIELDLFDSLGWKIASTEISDILARTSGKIRKKAEEDYGDNYFASREAQGVKRALENLQESAWWSKHLSFFMSYFCLAFIIILLILSIVALIISVHTALNVEIRSNIAKVITSTVMLIFTVGLFRLFIAYYNFGKAAEHCEKHVINCLRQNNCSEIDTIKAFNEYHLARNASPLIPTWAWKLKQENLNNLWKEYRA